MGIFGPSKKQRLASEPISTPAPGTKYLRHAQGRIPEPTEVAKESIRRANVDPSGVDLEVLAAAAKLLGDSQLSHWCSNLAEIGPDLKIVYGRSDFNNEMLTNFLLGRGSAQAVAAYNKFVEFMNENIPDELAGELRAGMYRR